MTFALKQCGHLQVSSWPAHIDMLMLMSTTTYGATCVKSSKVRSFPVLVDVDVNIHQNRKASDVNKR